MLSEAVFLLKDCRNSSCCIYFVP